MIVLRQRPLLKLEQGLLDQQSEQRLNLQLVIRQLLEPQLMPIFELTPRGKVMMHQEQQQFIHRRLVFTFMQGVHLRLE